VANGAPSLRIPRPFPPNITRLRWSLLNFRAASSLWDAPPFLAFCSFLEFSHDGPKVSCPRKRFFLAPASSDCLTGCLLDRPSRFFPLTTYRSFSLTFEISMVRAFFFYLLFGVFPLPCILCRASDPERPCLALATGIILFRPHYSRSSSPPVGVF